MTPPIALLVCGSRSWTDELFMGKALAKYPRGTLLVHGGAAGADLMLQGHRDAHEIASGRTSKRSTSGRMGRR